MVLAALSLGGGFLQRSGFPGTLFPTLEDGRGRHADGISVAAGLIGIAARLRDVRGEARHGRLAGAEHAAALYKLVYNKYFVDEIYDATVVKPTGRRLAPCSGRAWTPG